MDDVSQEDRELTVDGSRMTVGRFTYGFGGLTIYPFHQGASLNIGRYCSISPGIKILLGGEHPLDRFTTYPIHNGKAGDILGTTGEAPAIGTKGDVNIGNDVWIGFGATIMSGVTIGDGAVIAAQSHVHRDVAPYEIVGGNPARHIRYRFEPEIREGLMKLRWWEFNIESLKEIAGILGSLAPTKELLDLLLVATGTVEAETEAAA